MPKSWSRETNVVRWQYLILLEQYSPSWELFGMLRRLFLLFFLFPVPAFACGQNEYEVCFVGCGCVPNSSVFVPDPRETTGEIFGAAGDSLEFISNLPEESAEAIKQALSNVDKAVSDAAKILFKAADDIVDAGSAISRFVERQIAATPEILSAAEQRVREGKVVDALWHLSTDQAQATNNNAMQLAQENEYIAATAQAAAGFYGGPAGSAAYGAWKAYHDSGGKVDIALKSGALAYAISSGYADTKSLPTGTAGEVARKAALTGAISGISVAASGGSDEATLRTFLQAGSGIIVQSGQAYVRETAANISDVTMLQGEADIYCTMTMGGDCAQIGNWYAEAKTKIEAVQDAARDGPELIFTPDGNWSISWVKGQSELNNNKGSAPAILTYVGPRSPFFEKYRQIAALSGAVISNVTGIVEAGGIKSSPRPKRKPTAVAGSLQAYLDVIESAPDVQAKRGAKLEARKFLARSFKKSSFDDEITLVHSGGTPELIERRKFKIVNYNPDSNEVMLNAEIAMIDIDDGVITNQGILTSDVIVDLDLVFRADTTENGVYFSCNGQPGNCIKFLNMQCQGSDYLCDPATWALAITSNSTPESASTFRRFVQTIVYKIDGRPPK